jgi:hypothetical protein
MQAVESSGVREVGGWRPTEGFVVLATTSRANDEFLDMA